MLVVQQETTAKYGNRSVFDPVQALKKTRVLQEVGVASVRCRCEVGLASPDQFDQDFNITGDRRKTEAQRGWRTVR